MSRSNFDRVKLSIVHDIPTDAIVRELHLPLEEVNKAMLAADYDSYTSG